MASYSQLLKFIITARKKGYKDIQIRNVLQENKWPLKVIKKAFNDLYPKLKLRNQVCIFLSDDILNVLEKRSRKNLFTIGEQIEDILRRSAVHKSTSTSKNKKIDDLLISVFSRSPRGRKKKPKKKKIIKKKSKKN